MTIQSFANSIITGVAGPMLKRLWYAIIPSFPVWKTVHGLKICFDSRDHPFIWFTKGADLENAEGIEPFLKGGGSIFWDIGCNAGIYSLYAARNGWQVTAFDLSPKCTALLKRSAAVNALKVMIVTSAFTKDPVRYKAPATATAGNRIEPCTFDFTDTSMTWRQADLHFGTPHLIKMDIEGAELDLLNDTAFRDWITTNKITLLVETHSIESRIAVKRFATYRKIGENTYCAR